MKKDEVNIAMSLVQLLILCLVLLLLISGAFALYEASKYEIKRKINNENYINRH